MTEPSEAADTGAPWAMQLVARIEKLDPPSGADVAKAAVLSVIGLLEDERMTTDENWVTAVESWQQHGKIRKLVRRARASAWQRAQAPDGYTAQSGKAEVRAYLPSPMDEVPAEVAKLQIRSTPLDGSSDGAEDRTTDQRRTTDQHREHGGLMIAVTPEVVMSWGKVAAQCAHAGQLLWRDASPAVLAAWSHYGRPISILYPDDRRFAEHIDEAPVRVRDGGFTEIPAGTLTTVAWWELPDRHAEEPG